MTRGALCAGGLMLVVQDLTTCEETESMTVQPGQDTTDSDINPGTVVLPSPHLLVLKTSEFYLCQVTSTRDISWCWVIHSIRYHDTHKSTHIPHVCTHTHTHTHIKQQTKLASKVLQ